MDEFSILNILVPLWIFSNIAGGLKRMWDRDNSFISFVKFLADVLFYPAIKVYEEFK